MWASKIRSVLNTEAAAHEVTSRTTSKSISYISKDFTKTSVLLEKLKILHHVNIFLISVPFWKAFTNTLFCTVWFFAPLIILIAFLSPHHIMPDQTIFSWTPSFTFEFSSESQTFCPPMICSCDSKLKIKHKCSFLNTADLLFFFF